MEVELFVLERAPQPLDEDVVQAAALPVHADAHVGGAQHARERLGGELRPLVGVEAPGLAEARERLTQGLDAEAAVERLGQPPREHAPAVPVEDRHEIDEPAVERSAGCVRTALRRGARARPQTSRAPVPLRRAPTACSRATDRAARRQAAAGAQARMGPRHHRHRAEPRRPDRALVRRGAPSALSPEQVRGRTYGPLHAAPPGGPTEPTAACAGHETTGSAVAVRAAALRSQAAAGLRPRRIATAPPHAPRPTTLDLADASRPQRSRRPRSRALMTGSQRELQVGTS